MLDVAGVDAARVEHGELVAAEVLADGADDVDLVEERRGQPEVDGGAAEHPLADPNGVVTASKAIEPTAVTASAAA